MPTLTLVGKPNKLTEALTEQYTSLLRDGAPIHVAASLCNVTYQSIENWLESGKDPDNRCHDFRVRVMKAIADNANEAIQQWRELNKTTTDFRSLQNYLAVLHQMSAPSKVEVTGQVSMQHSVDRPDLSKLTVDELQTYLDRIHANEKLIAGESKLLDAGAIDVDSEEMDS